ncbi:family 43 glycosylhydrolase [Streptomyces sp. DSM 42041]|uniref:Family 43 glycosylhydrolase n=1 Tax=Streptomyces hazeniae TaxID=3075538 RepID=A0ABU2P0D1_9ACTN|nr:family 43 glycosylhydrolase [Streptomyces sp. DSM 42041]MDT0381923.1 family 43 glycosylhydrolase [Streptomyces sp. DSM 42041]
MRALRPGTLHRRTAALTLGLALALGALAPQAGAAPPEPGPATSAEAAGAAAAARQYPDGRGRFANPGVVHDGDKWVMLSTGSWSTGGRIAVADAAKGPWDRLSRDLLTRRPQWASTSNHSVWAPSIARADDGGYVVYYSAVVRGTDGRRCIGTGRADRSTGPFVPHDRPIACWAGSGTNPFDAIPSESGNFKLIDATPARVGSQLVLTYKTSNGYQSSGRQMWHTTTRMLKLDPARPDRPVANPRHADGGSIKLTDARSKYIEENPVMVKRGARYTLFTSFGWYGTCDYHTRYRQNGSLWNGWLDRGPTRLPMPSDTCGTGNAHVVRGLPDDSWRVFYNGHVTDVRRSPFTLYVGWVAWNNGRPKVPGRL